MKGLRSAFSFFTIIPISSDLDDHLISYIPLVAMFDAAVGVSLYVVLYHLSRMLAALISISSIYIINGLNHVDAVADTGDALMVRNSARTTEIFKDHHVGAGGVFTLTFIYLLALISLSSMGLYIGVASVIVAEFFSKSTMMLMLHRSRPIIKGIGSLFIEFYNQHPSAYAAEFLIVPVVVSLIFPVSLVLSVLLGFLIFMLAKTMIVRRFGGINGDIAGFMGEFSRSIFLFISLLLAQSSMLSTYDIFSKIISSL
ncbi:adenosylcobinamide-GDP ribazoletransferase [Thermoplasma sp.]|uniref:adenosylcobinamide-GDP ribazoletransferase n=1 Tax=Thermoplasma sp. TaxID=1973142 RepID=UPI00126C478C|nr:adenosylcobinamide-GDP ribazoletransferase [Thermoplasma sp.]KAA8922975.1 MAG: adenosylcobinamide-GDP ribazoletransferase [Thermoplasma sp.]